MVHSSNNLLEVRNLSKAFYGVQALNDVHFDLRPGEVHGLIGENGAGKSTLVKILSGIEKKDAGDIKINEQPVHIRNPQHARRLGIAAIFQELSQIQSLTIAENVFLNQESVKAGIFLDRAAIIRKTRDILKTYSIDLAPETLISDLSVGHRQLVEIVKAISLGTRILIMDEPTASLSEVETQVVFNVIEDYKKTGAGIIYISHRMDEIFSQTDRVTILRDGQFVHCGNTAKLDLPTIVKHMVGREVEIYQSTDKSSSKVAVPKPRLEIKNFTKKEQFTDVSFKVNEGEIFGIAGLVGSGRSELVEAIFGICKPDSGKISIDGLKVSISSVKDALKHGIALLPEDRHTKGLVLDHTIEQNMILPVLKDFCFMMWLNYRKIRQFVRDNIRCLSIRPNDPKKVINYLSGGNQQKVAIAKWLATNPHILMVDEPTAGIDVHAKSEVHNLLRNLAKKGVSIIMISSELPELLAHSDRVMVMNHGRVLGIYNEIEQEQIMSLIMQDIINNRAAMRKEVG